MIKIQVIVLIIFFTEIIIPPPPPPPVPSRAPKSIGEQQIQDRIDSPTTPPSPSVAPSASENGGANRIPVASGPGRPSPNPGLHLTPNTEHLGIVICFIKMTFHISNSLHS